MFAYNSLLFKTKQDGIGYRHTSHLFCERLVNYCTNPALVNLIQQDGLDQFNPTEELNIIIIILNLNSGLFRLFALYLLPKW